MRHKHNPNPFDVGDRVGYRPDFLRIAGMTGGWAAKARGTVSRIDGMLCVVDWDDAPRSTVGSGSLLLDHKRRV